MPHRTVRCIGAVQMSTSHSRKNEGVLHYNSPDCPVSQWSNGSQRQRSTLQSATVARQSQKHRSQRAPECLVWLEDNAPQRSTAQNPNDCADVARTGQCTVAVRWRTGLSGAPIASSLGQRLQSGWGL
jgi:hypothetical protein